MNKNVVVFSITVVAIIFTFFLFSIFAILYFYWGNFTAAKDSLSTASGFFGGIATLGTALVAAYLFNDWKVQQIHQNTVKFGMEVYTSFKEFDSLFKKISSELITNQIHIRFAQQNNDFTEMDQYLASLNETSKKDVELTEKFFNLHESIINYCIVTNQENIIVNDLVKTAESINKYFLILTDIRFENNLQIKLEYTNSLNTPPFNQINVYIYNYYIKLILLQIRLD